jgi:hypothetical protein
MSNFHEFLSEELCCEERFLKKNFDVWTLESCGFHGMSGCNSLKSISKKVTLSPTITFLSLRLSFWGYLNYVREKEGC